MGIRLTKSRFYGKDLAMGLADRLWQVDRAVKLSEVSAEVKTVIEDVARLCPQARVLLFGSFAKSVATLGSDVDLAVILPDEVDKKIFKKSFFRNRTRIGMPVDFIFRNESEFLENEIDSPIDQVIHQDGVELYPNWMQP